MEKWRDIKGFEEKYQISSYGRVRRKDNLMLLTLTHDKHGSGYQRCNLYANGKSNIKSVHRLVAETFISNKLQKAHVHHKDGDKQNNRVSNLMWVTNEEHGSLKSIESKRKFRETYKRNKQLWEMKT